MAWQVELDRAAVRDMKKLDRPTARRILTFLQSRVAALDDPRSKRENTASLPRLDRERKTAGTQ